MQVSQPAPTTSPSRHAQRLSRVSRIAESHHLQSTIAGQDLRFPTVVIPGASHASFLSGYPPLLVRSRDLRPEASEADVHATAAQLFASFVQQIITRAPVHLPPLAQAVAASRDFFAPIQLACDPAHPAPQPYRVVCDSAIRYLSEGNPFFPLPPVTSMGHAMSLQAVPYAQVLQDTVAGALPSSHSVAAADTRASDVKVRVWLCQRC